MSEQTQNNPEDEAESLLAPVRYSLPRMLAEVAKDRETVREAGKLLNQDQIGAVFSSHRKKGDDV